ncbi:MAG: hypothetical protein KGH79_00805 [Patescibacteria group bacterium]|nr:hypothetical protein [Patescibacteria group bacterium]
MRYIEHIKTKSTHERRAHAIQMSSAILIVVFLVWVSTLGWRFASIPPQTASSDVSQTASVVQASNGNATLLVSTTTDSYGQ